MPRTIRSALMSSLDQYMAKLEPVPPPLPRQDPKAQLNFRPSIPLELAESYFVGAGYDGERRAVYLKLYEPKSQKIHFWYDNTGHTPYCLSKELPEKLEKNQSLVRHPGFVKFERSKRFDALKGEDIPVTVIYAKDPLSIGGRPTGCIRDIIKAWEADIRYTENYIYDRQLEPGMVYKVEEGRLQFGSKEDPAQTITDFREGDEEYKKLVSRWLGLLEAPLPTFRRLALDIEVHSPIDTRVPDPTLAEYKVICASLCGSDGTRRVLVLKRPEMGEATAHLEDTDVEFFETEEDLIANIFKALNDYPLVLTFNGDDFDLRYLHNRALNRGFTRDQIPVELGRESAGLKYGIHLDLYRFFFNRSIQVYAFGNRYREVTLDAISEARLEVGKAEILTPISRLSYTELDRYCL